MLYDQAGRRFLYYKNSTSDRVSYNQFNPELENATEYTIKLIPFRNGNVTEVDPSALVKEQKMLYMGQGYGEDMYADCIYAVGLGQDKCYVYEFENGYPFMYEDYGASFKAYHEKDIPEGLTEESCFASSRMYSGIFFYTSRNTVCRYDFNTGGVREIYHHEGAIKAVCMEFAKGQENYLEDDSFMGNNYAMPQQMGIAFEMADGSYEFVVLHLDGTGKINVEEAVYPSQQVYKGLGRVADIAFV